ncbi:MAG: hypothetical protein IBX71_00990 [Candidatus Desulforudis sp.]|nr:hypothetical protein [Desulforudis sp.]
MTCLLLYGGFAAGLSTAAVPPELEGLVPGGLEALERELATELLTLNLQIMGLQEDHERVERRLVELAESAAVEERKLAAARTRLEATQHRLGSWVRYLYEEGRLPLLGILLQAENTTDFLRRLDFVRLLVDYEYGLLTEVQTLNAAIRERLHHLAALNAETVEAESRITVRLAELERTQNRRSEFLASVRGHSAGLADRLAGLEQQWQSSLTPLQRLLEQLGIALVRDLQPDRVYFQGRNMVVEVSSPTINRALLKAAGDSSSNLRVGINTQGMTVAAVDRGGRTNFHISGRLVPVSGGERVVFRAETVVFDGLEIDAAALPFLKDQGSFSMASRFQFMTVVDITHEENKLRFTLRRN